MAKKKKNFKKKIKKFVKKYKPYAKKFAKQTAIRYKKFVPHAKRFAEQVEVGGKQMTADMKSMGRMYQTQPQFSGWKVIFLGREGTNTYPDEKIAKEVLATLYQNYTGGKAKKIPTNIGSIRRV